MCSYHCGVNLAANTTLQVNNLSVCIVTSALYHVLWCNLTWQHWYQFIQNVFQNQILGDCSYNILAWNKHVILTCICDYAIFIDTFSFMVTVNAVLNLCIINSTNKIYHFLPSKNDINLTLKFNNCCIRFKIEKLKKNLQDRNVVQVMAYLFYDDYCNNK